MEYSNGGDDNFRGHLSELLGLDIPKVQCVVLFLLVPHSGYEFGIELDARPQIVLLSETFPVCENLLTWGEHMCPIRIGVCGKPADNVGNQFGEFCVK